MSLLPSVPPGGIAVVVGSRGGIGSALHTLLAQEGRFAAVVGLHRHGEPPVDVTDEATVATAAQHVARLDGDVRLIINAAGVLQDALIAAPEKTWRQLDAGNLARYFAVNAIGPALLIKHFLPLLPRVGKSVFATLSARVGSIGDNRLGGWYGYRASKAALNQLVRTAAIELARQRPAAVCVALHPGTVDTPLSSRHDKAGLTVRTPREAAELLAAVMERVTPGDTGCFLDQLGEPIPW